MIIIGIAGGTGSGKTTVVRKIMERLPEGEVGVISQDSYYKDSSHVPVEERQNINFDEPWNMSKCSSAANPSRCLPIAI